MFRPVGQAELELVAESGFTRWPPRLPEQPIFYPVTNEEYASQIARDWNASDSETGYVTTFDVDEHFLRRFDQKVVGDSRIHVEYWIPAEELEEFNDHIVGEIHIVRAFRGDPPVEVEVS